MKKYRVYVPTDSVTIAHVVRPLQVAKVLRQKGVEVIFGANERYRALIEKEGFEVRPVYCADPAILLDAVRRLDFKRQLAHIPNYLESDLEAIKSLQPDLVFSDCRFTARLAAEKIGVPHVAMANGIYSPYYDALWSIPQTISFSWPSWLRENRLLGRSLRATVLRLKALPYRRLCRRYRLNTEIKFGFDIFLSSTLTLLCDIPEFSPQKDLPGNFHFIGPILWEQESSGRPMPAEFDGKRRPLIHIMFGTSGEEALLDQMVRSLQDLPYDIVVSMAAPRLGKYSDNVLITPFVKVSEILKKASLLICHGGSGTIYHAMAHGVPILCVPTFYDQEWNGDRVKELGLGDSIFHKRLDAAALRAAVARIIGDAKIKENLRRFQSLMPKWNGPELAAARIMELLEKSR